MLPIVALATPPFRSALALIRLSGNGVISLLEGFLERKIDHQGKRTIVHGKFAYGGKDIDDIIAFVYPAPNTVTGEDMVEITCHGSMVIANEIIAAFLGSGCQYATNGEFSSRAFYNGKIDLIQAEAINDMINATTAEAKNVALLSLEGKTSAKVLPLKVGIADILALLEVGIDYPEYDEEETLTREDFLSKIASLREDLKTLIVQGQQGKIIRNGIDVAIVGEPNVGKSSLLNALLNEEKAIVSPIPGTTRDIVEGMISIHGIPVHLLDTAGIHATEDEIEKIGVERSRKSIRDADLVVLVYDAMKPSMDKEIEEFAQNKKTIRIYNKADLVTEGDKDKLYVSALHQNIEPLKEAIFKALAIDEESYYTPALSNERELGLLRQIDAELSAVEVEAKAGASFDILSLYMQRAYQRVKELLGEEASQDLSDEIFSRFCVGK